MKRNVKGVVFKVLFPLSNEGIIEECINDIFLSIWNHSKKFSGDSTDFQKWICAIAKFKAIDYYRRVSKKVEVTSEHVDFHAEKSAEEEWIMMEDKKELITLINFLESLHQEIFTMKFFLGLKTEEIAR